MTVRHAFKRQRVFSLVAFLIAIAAVGTFIAITLPAVAAVRAASRPMTCPNRLQDVAVATLAFQAASGVLPPTRIVAAQVAGPPARGQIERDGRFRLSTLGRDGARPGAYRVAVVQPGEAAAGGRHGHRLIDPRFARFETSGLECNVEGGMADLRFCVRPPATRNRPAR